MDRIKYLCYYDYQDDKKPREGVQAASSKIDYIINAINRCGIKVDLISKSPVSSDTFNLDLGGAIRIGVNTLRHFASFGCRNSILRVASRWLQNIHFFIWLLLNVKRNETIIVYHSLGYCRMVSLIKRIKGCKIIGEIEEVYQDVHHQSRNLSQDEYNFIEHCDKFIFPTAIMNDKLNVNDKPYVVVHGVYKSQIISESKFSDGRIHVVYGGTFDPEKGGALAAAGIGRHLPKNYVVHICGFGSDVDKQNIQELIQQVNKTSDSKTIFEGQLKGLDYEKFIQKCHIGLSTQNPAGAFNDTSFPSKILVYMANGLDVVTINIPAVKTSSVSEFLNFYEIQDSQSIANAVLKVKVGERDYSDLLNYIDSKFENEIKALL